MCVNKVMAGWQMRGTITHDSPKHALARDSARDSEWEPGWLRHMELSAVFTSNPWTGLEMQAGPLLMVHQWVSLLCSAHWAVGRLLCSWSVMRGMGFREAWVEGPPHLSRGFSPSSAMELHGGNLPHPGNPPSRVGGLLLQATG